MDTPTAAKKIIAILKGSCSKCSLLFQNTSVHIPKCYDHGLCGKCYLEMKQGDDEFLCPLCVPQSTASIPRSGDCSALIKPNTGKMQQDFRRGIIEDSRVDGPTATICIWESQTYGNIVFPVNGSPCGLIQLEPKTNTMKICNLDSVHVIVGGMSVSPKATAMIVQTIFGNQRQLALFDIDDVDTENNSPRLIRLFSPVFPEKARRICEYDHTSFGVYCCTDTPRLEIFKQKDFSHTKTIQIEANYQPHHDDAILVGKEGFTYLTSFNNDHLLILDGDGNHLQTVGHPCNKGDDLPGRLCGPVGMFQDDKGTILIANNDGCFQLYSDGNWSVIKSAESKESGLHLHSVCIGGNAMFGLYGPRTKEANILATYTIIS